MKTKRTPVAAPESLEPVSVVLADDHELFRSGLARTIGAYEGLELVAQASNGIDALAAIEELEPTVALIDVRMPGCDGFHVCDWVARHEPPLRTRVLLATTFAEENVLAAATTLTAAGILAKENSRAYICAALLECGRSVAPGGALDAGRGTSSTARLSADTQAGGGERPPLRSRTDTPQRHADDIPGVGGRSGPPPARSHGSHWRRPLVEAPIGIRADRRERRLRASLAAADLFAGALALVGINSLYGRGSFVAPRSLLVLPAVFLFARALGMYHKDEVHLRRSTLDDAPGLFQLATLFALTVWLARHVVLHSDLNGAHVMTLLVGFLAAAFSARVIARTIARRTIAPERCLVVGDRETANRLRRALSYGASGSAIVCAVGCENGAAEEQCFSDLSHPANLAAVVERHMVDRLIVAPCHPGTDHVHALVHTAKALGLRITILPFLDGVMGAAAEVESIGGMTVLDLPRFALSRSAQLMKRSFDLVGAGVSLFLLAPVLAAAAALVKLDSPGPVLFRQLRMGRGGKPFYILKLRTMVADAEDRRAQLEPANEALGLFKIAKDPRVTRVGRVLRRASIDELPQLWNVLRGDMSLVGPRPLVADEDAKVVGWFRNRLQLQPGITGQWQVLGSARIPLDDMIRIDYLYVANWSLWGDVKLLLETVPYVLAWRGM